jgi:outer membrane protein TolC
MKMLRNGIGLLALAIELAAGRARAEVLSLRDLERKAIELRGMASTEQARAASSRAEIGLARSAYMPTATLNAGTTIGPGGAIVKVRDMSGCDQKSSFSCLGDEFYVSGSKPLGRGDTGSAFIPHLRYTATIGLQGRIYDFGRTSAAVDAAEAKLAAVGAEARAQRAQLIAEVRGAYFEWMVRMAAYSASQRTLADARQRRELVEGFIKDGVRPPADLVPVRRYEAAARLEEVKARGERDGALDQLALAVGGPLPETGEPDSSLLNRTQIGSAVPSTADASAQRRKRDAALAIARAHENWRLPVLAATAEGGVRGQEGYLFPNYQLGASLTMPLWDGGSENARAEMSRAEARAFELQARQADYAARAQNTGLKRRFYNAAERVKVAEEVRMLAETELRNAEDRYSLGQGSIEAVLDARGYLTSADSDLLLARLARAEAALRLEPAQ